MSAVRDTELASLLLARPTEVGASIDVALTEAWERARPGVVAALSTLRDRRWPVPGLRGLPPCLVSIQDRPLLAPLPGNSATFPVCQRCDHREACAPPPRVSSAMQPCSKAPLRARWSRFLAGLRAVAGIAPDPRVEACAEHLIALCEGPLQRRVDLEPSVVVGDGIERSVRFVCFYGENKDALEGAQAFGVLKQAWRELHALIGAEVPEALRRWLEIAPVLPFHVGLEAKAGREPEVRGYLVVASLGPERKRALVDALVPADRRPAWFDDRALEATGMLGFGSCAGEATTIKAYVRRSSRQGWLEAGLPALGDDHPGVALAKERSLAVVDISAPAARANKWDVRTAEQLVTGGNLVESLAGALSADACDSLRQLIAACDVRLELSNAGFRGSRTALYFWLG